ncbi:MAG: 2'-5' RNA ligase family protein [Chloroflexota bacterium]
MTLLVLAYPELANDDYKGIQELRRDHDELHYHLVEPHFTLVFPLPEAWQVDDLTAEVTKQARSVQPFEFTIRCATLNKNAFNDLYHAFLVPDEGYSHIVKLHNALYGDKLFPQWALQVDFIPHIRIGSSTDPLGCLQVVENWNRLNLELSGTVSTLDIVNHENETVQTLKRVSLY